MTERNIPEGAGARFTPAETPQGAPPEFADRANRVGTIQLDLGTARDNKEIDIAGTMLWAIDASDLDASIDVKFNDQIGTGVTVERGFFLRGVAFNQLYVTNSAQAGKTIKLFYAVEGRDNIQIENPLVAFQNVKIDQGDTYTGSGDTNINDATTDTIAADGTRREITIQADDGNTGPLFVRDTNGNNMAKLNAGDSYTLPGTAELQVRNDSGSTQTYRTAEVLD